MAVTFVKRSTLPAAVKGKVGTLSVCVTGNGQIVLSGLATKALNEAKKVVAAFDGGAMYVFQDSAKLVSKVDAKDMISLSFSKKGGTASFSGAAILRAALDFGASHVYDFKASGNQSFAVTVNEKNQCLSFELPEKLVPRPVTHRVKKIKATATRAEVGSTDGVVEDEIPLELA